MQIPKPAWPMAIDVSEANNAGKPINWAEVVPKLRSRGIDRVIVRASYGGGYEDALFGHNWTALGMLDFPRAAYHAAVPSEVSHLIESSHQQAAFLLGHRPSPRRDDERRFRGAGFGDYRGHDSNFTDQVGTPMVLRPRTGHGSSYLSHRVL